MKPKLTAVIFTYPRDYEMAGIAARSLRNAGARVYFAIDQRDKALHIDGGGIVRTSFERRGNLNGMACAEGILETMELCANQDGADWVVKVDSDTIVHDFGWLEPAIANGMGMVGTGYDEEKGVKQMVYGCCYGIRRDFLPELRDKVVERGTKLTAAEDVMMGNAANELGMFQRYILYRDFYFGPHSESLTPRQLLERYSGTIAVQRTGKHPSARAEVAEKMRALYAEKWGTGEQK